jgi:hypothetical protein
LVPSSSQNCKPQNVFTLTSLFAADSAKRKGQKYFFMQISKHFFHGNIEVVKALENQTTVTVGGAEGLSTFLY